MNTNDIINSVINDFSNKYTFASQFVNSGEVWDFCMETLKNPTTLSCIVFANDFGIPPVNSLLELYRREKNPDEQFQFSGQVNKNIGHLMGFVFKDVLGYTEQKDDCTIDILGAKTATLFLNGPTVTFKS